MNRLLSVGFINAGHWKLNEGKSLKYHLISHHQTKNILYAFVSNGIIKYVGKTIMSLARRMYGYQNPGPSQSTNIRVNKEITNLLSTDQPVDIFILVDNGLLKYGDFRINLAAGLEDTLIYEKNPEWNFSGKSKIEEDKESKHGTLNLNRTQISDIPPISDTFEISLGKAYYTQGFFNVKQAYSEKFGTDKSVIEIQLGENPENLIKGYINRTANSNGTPRIMGGKTLSYWIKSKFKQNEMLLVSILSPVSMKLNERIK